MKRNRVVSLSLLIVALLAAPLFVGGCSARLKSTHNGFTYRGLGGSAYAVAGSDVFHRLDDSNYLSAGIFKSAARKGEWASVDVWPLFGVGVGLAGARVQVLPFEVGLGVLAYKPSPPPRIDYEDEYEEDDWEVEETHDAEEYRGDEEHDDEADEEDFR